MAYLGQPWRRSSSMPTTAHRLPTADLIGQEVDFECGYGLRWRLEHYFGKKGGLLGPSESCFEMVAESPLFLAIFMGARPCAFREPRPPLRQHDPSRGVSCQPALRAASSKEASMLSKLFLSILSITGPVSRPIEPPLGTYR
jgi:hypothetical protein